MDLTPEAIRAATFSKVKRGYAVDEVDEFKGTVADQLAAAVGQATAMEARARAAVAKLQELVSEAAAREITEPAVADASEAVQEVGDPEAELSERISRTVLLAQRTADAAIEDARERAQAIVEQAERESERIIEAARVLAAQMVADGRDEARRAGDEERRSARHDVEQLRARCAALIADADVLDSFLERERTRLRDAAGQLIDLVERVPGGLAAARRPEMSDSHEPPAPEPPLSPERLAADDFWDVEADSSPGVGGADTGSPTVGGATVGSPDVAPAEVDGPATASSDSGESAAGTSRAGSPDNGEPETATSDTGTPEAGTPDAGAPDAGAPDAGAPDAGAPDAGGSAPHRVGAPVDAAAAPAHGPTTDESELGDDWDEISPAPASTSRSLDEPWDDIPTSAASRSAREFEDDTFWSIPRPAQPDDIDVIPAATDDTVPLAAPDGLHIGGEELR